MTEQTLLTIEQVGKRLQLSRSKIYALIGEGRLKTVKIGTAARIRSGDIDEFIAQLKGRDDGNQS